jgi:membrane-bound metal-dependent hydrolase YbcI (DUF457 family)
LHRHFSPGDYRLRVAYFVASVYIFARTYMSSLRAGLFLALFAIVAAACTDNGPLASAWVVAGVVLALVIAVYILIRSGGSGRK